MSDMLVQAEIKLKDNLSRPAGTALESVKKSAEKAGSAVDSVGRSDGMRRVARDASDAARGMDAVGRNARAAGHGLDSAARGARQTREATQAAERQTAAMQRHTQGIAQNMRAAAGALAAAGYVAKAATDKPVDYEKQLAGMANVAFAERDAAGRIAGMRELDAAITGAIRSGGGKREDAAATLNAMLASGAVDESTAKDKLLPVIMKASTASGASGEELANILIKGISQGQFGADEAQLAIDKALKAGEAGQFELKDMARWLPQIISAGKGMKGMEGFDAHLANLQGIAQVTGSQDQAGNAYFNLLGKLTSTDATNNFKKLGIDLPTELAKGRMQGKDTVSTFVDLVQDRVVGKDKRYQALQKKIAATTDKDEKRELMEQAAEILQGTAVGKVIQDREALLGLVGVMNQRDTIADVLEKLKNAGGSTQTSFDVISQTGAYARERIANEKDVATSALYDNVKNPVNAALNKTADLAQNNPVVAQTAVGVATAGTAAAAGGAAASALGGGGAVAGAASGLSRLLGGAAKNSPIIAGILSALKVYNTATDENLTTAEKKINNMETYGEFGGALSGAAMGAAAGSAVPLIGNVVGGALGAILGYFAGGSAGKGAGQLLWGDEAAAERQEKKPDEQAAVVQAAQILQQQPINATIQLNVDLDGDRVAAAVEQRQLRESNRR